MFDYRKLTVISIAAISLCGCATNRQSGTWIGAAAGAVIGGLIEDEAAAVAAGAIAGGLIGRMIGSRMDRKEVANALEHSAANETTAWFDPETGKHHRITPQAFHMRGDQVCRHFELVTIVDGRKEVTRGTACRRADGAWMTS